MKKSIVFNWFLLLFMLSNSYSSFSQCIMPLTNSGYDMTLHDTVIGQSFISTCDGLIDDITVQSNASTASITDVTLKIWKENLQPVKELIYTQTGVTLNGFGVPTPIIVTGDADLELASVYYFTLHHASTDLELHTESVGTFLTGNAIDFEFEPTDISAQNDIFFEVEASEVLPVEMNYFTVSLKNNTAILNWMTQSEEYNSGFEVYKSTDGIEWDILDFIPGEMASNAPINYTYTDVNLKPGYNYYRLIQIDMDGQRSFLEIQAVYFEFIGKAFIYPNPAVNKLSINISEYLEDRALNIVDIYGNKVLATDEVTCCFEQIDISHLQDGLYLITSENTTIGKFIKREE